MQSSWFEMCNLLSTKTTMSTPIEKEEKEEKKKRDSNTKFTLIFKRYSSFYSPSILLLQVFFFALFLNDGAQIVRSESNNY